ncbi:hypothetical protein [Natronospira bacteriovora]|uniref:Outer membrane protein beta-barrel domain-containing protein n=1 Tax=Natronospira bacteriovora TaxID=3069753 RepID=A0ABU0W951_9GAMM|nr:hypothetical protein [Natronospira sp. AB-CW4]MDQ2070288.1 hypothetical protein [Natronospira sp. AB-CW4]
MRHSMVATSMLAVALLLPLLFAPAHASVQIHGYQEVSSTAAGTIRGTGLRLRWLATPGTPLGGDWYFRPGAEVTAGQFQDSRETRRYWEATGLGRLEFRGESVGFYAQGGIGRLEISGEYQDPLSPGARVFEDNDTLLSAEVGLRLYEGVRMDVGLRYQRYQEAGVEFRGVVVGLGF